MRYAEFPPSPPLAGLVRCYWTLSAEAVPGGAPAETVFPDGCMELIFHLGDRFRRRAEDGWRVQPRAILAGQFRSFLTLQAIGSTEMVAARLEPAGAWPLVGHPLDTFTGDTPALDDVVGGTALHLLERIGNTVGARERVRLLDEFLRVRCGQQPPVHCAVTAAARILDERRGHVTVDDLAALVGTSSRHLERLFRREVGVTPKLLGRVLRFQGVFDHVDDGGARPDWSGIALAAGYYDQAHFIRDFRAFTGSTPTRWLAEQPRLAGLLTTGAA